jgi:hypothetical protein
MVKWIGENRKLLILLAKVAAAIGLVTLVVTAAIVPVSALAVAWAALNSQIFAVPIAIGLAVVAFLAMIAMIGLIAEDIVAFTKGKDSIFGRFLIGLNTLTDILKENLVNRFRETWAIIKDEALAIWENIIARIGEMWQAFVDTRLTPILEAFEAIQKVIGFVSPGAALAGRAASLAAGAAQPAAGATSMEINVAVAPPVGTSATGVAQAVVTAFKASVNQLTMGRTGLGR